LSDSSDVLLSVVVYRQKPFVTSTSEFSTESYEIHLLMVCNVNIVSKVHIILVTREVMQRNLSGVTDTYKMSHTAISWAKMLKQLPQGYQICALNRSLVHEILPKIT
jgi:hypothetical protein